MFLFLAVLNFALIQPPKATGVYDSGFIRNTQKLFRISLLQFNLKLKILSNLHGFSKGGFFLESAFHFFHLQISKKKIFQKAALSLKFKFPANNSKQQIQISSSG